MFFNELKVLLLMRSGSGRRTDTGADGDTQTRMRGLGIGDCGWPHLGCSHQDDEEEYYGSVPRPRSLALEDSRDQGAKGGKAGGGGEDGEGGGGGGGGSLGAPSLPSLSDSGMRSPQCRICFQGPEKVQYGGVGGYSSRDQKRKEKKKGVLGVAGFSFRVQRR